MGVVALLRRRWREHPSALAAVLAAVLVSLLVVAALRGFSGGIADASVRGSVAAADPERRSLTVTLPLRPDRAAAAEAAVTTATAGITGRDLYAARLATSRGLAGGAPTDRIQLAEIPQLAAHARLTAGHWPAPAASGAPIEVAVPESVAAALHWQVGARADLVDLIDDQAKPTSITVVGVYSVTDRASPLWRLLPIALTGIERGDFTAYGPVVVSAGTLRDQTLMLWLADLVPDRLDLATAGPAADAADRAVEALQKSPSLAGASVTSNLGDVLRTAEGLGQRTGRVLLTPMLLLLLLGGAALALAAGQLAMLRDPESRLLRARGAGTGQLVALALVEGGVVIVASAIGALLIAPLLLRPLARASGFPDSASGYRHTVTSPEVWVAVAVGGLLALGVYVLASLRHGHLRVERADDGRGRLARLASGAGIDIVLLALGALGLVQLRRYAGTSGGASVDPLTLAAPALVVGGLCVLALRLIPLLARAGARVAAGGSSLGRAWSGWQVSRRMSAQAGSILLVLLCLTMGALAVSQQATVGRSLADQSDFEAGAPLRVAIGGELYADPLVPGRMARIAGASDRSMRAVRQGVEVGGIRGVSLLAADTRAAGVISPRPDLLGGTSWAGLTGRLRTGGVPGLELPGQPRTLSLDATIGAGPNTYIGGGGLTLTVILADVAGQWWTRDVPVPPGDLRPGQSRHVTATVPLSDAEGHVDYPARLVGAALAAPFFDQVPEKDRPTLTVARVGADADSVDPSPMKPAWRGSTLVVSVPLTDPGPVPVLMTRELARRARIATGATFAMPMGGATRSARLVGLIEDLPTATTPELGVLADLGTLQRAIGSPGPGDATGLRLVASTEYWLDPADPAAARAALAATPRLAAGVTDRDRVLADRRAGSVNAGMRTAMGLVTAAALLLAALGFAAATTAPGAVRRQEAVILTALGYGPGPQRRVLLAERAIVVLLTTIVGLVVAAVASRLVTPLLVSGDGHAQVPPVVVVLDWPALLALAAGLILVLVAIAAVLARRAGDVAAALRDQERE